GVVWRGSSLQASPIHNTVLVANRLTFYQGLKGVVHEGRVARAVRSGMEPKSLSSEIMQRCRAPRRQIVPSLVPGPMTKPMQRHLRLIAIEESPMFVRGQPDRPATWVP